MRGVRVNFLGDTASISFDSEVEGFWPTVQNTTLMVGQKKNSDIIYPEKGNSVQPGKNNMGTFENVSTITKLMSVSLQKFTNETDTDRNDHKLVNYNLALHSVDSLGIKLEVNAVSNKGERVTTTI